MSLHFRHNFVHLGLGELIDKLKVASQESSSLADLANNFENGLSNLSLHLAWFAAKAKTYVDELEN